MRQLRDQVIVVFSRLLDYLDGIYGVVYRSETSDHGRRRSFVAVTPSLTGETLVGATHVGVGNLKGYQILFVTQGDRGAWTKPPIDIDVQVVF